MEIINEASGKLRDKQDEVLGFLFDLLRQMNTLETEIYERNNALEAKRSELGIPKHIVAPGQNELWDEYEKRLSEIVTPCCTEKLLKRCYGISFGNPPKYGYIDKECKINFIMKTAKKATVIAHFEQGVFQMTKFVIKDMDGKWQVDEVYYGFESAPDKWHIESIH